MGGKHSTRAMQLAVKIYKKAGGGYRGSKSSRINYLNGLNKNGEQAAEKNQKVKDVTYLIKLGKVYLQKKKQQLIELKLVVQKKVSNLLNNLKLLLLKLKGSENENNK